MSRETALKNLSALRDEIITVYYEVERAKGLQQKLDEMRDEYDNPKPFSFTGKNEHTAADLKQKFLKENGQKVLKGRLFERIWIILNCVALLALAVYVFLPMFGVTTWTTKEIFLKEIDGMFFGIIVLIGHLLLSGLAVVPGFCVGWDYTEEGNSIFVGIAAIFSMLFVGGWISAVIAGVLIFIWVAFLVAFHAGWIGYALLAVLAAASIVPQISVLIRKLASKKPSITSAQAAEITRAEATDEENKRENVGARAEAEKQYHIALAARQDELRQAYEPTVNEAVAAAESARQHMEKLDSMDYLAEDDKDINTIDILIGIIKNHRADSIKEALQEYDKMKLNEQLLAIEQEKLEVARKKAADERADRQRAYERQLAEQRMANEQAHRDSMYLAQQQEWHNQAMEKAARAKASEMRHISDTLYDIKSQNYNEYLYNR